jgi:hypothetical protein
MCKYFRACPKTSQSLQNPRLSASEYKRINPGFSLSMNLELLLANRKSDHSFFPIYENSLLFSIFIHILSQIILILNIP